MMMMMMKTTWTSTGEGGVHGEALERGAQGMRGATEMETGGGVDQGPVFAELG